MQKPKPAPPKKKRIRPISYLKNLFRGNRKGQDEHNPQELCTRILFPALLEPEQERLAQQLYDKCETAASRFANAEEAYEKLYEKIIAQRVLDGDPAAKARKEPSERQKDGMVTRDKIDRIKAAVEKSSAEKQMYLDAAGEALVSGHITSEEAQSLLAAVVAMCKNDSHALDILESRKVTSEKALNTLSLTLHPVTLERLADTARISKILKSQDLPASVQNTLLMVIKLRKNIKHKMAQMIDIIDAGRLAPQPEENLLSKVSEGISTKDAFAWLEAGNVRSEALKGIFGEKVFDGIDVETARRLLATGKLRSETTRSLLEWKVEEEGKAKPAGKESAPGEAAAEEIQTVDDIEDEVTAEVLEEAPVSAEVVQEDEVETLSWRRDEISAEVLEEAPVSEEILDENDVEIFSGRPDEVSAEQAYETLRSMELLPEESQVFLRKIAEEGTAEQAYETLRSMELLPEESQVFLRKIADEGTAEQARSLLISGVDASEQELDMLWKKARS